MGALRASRRSGGDISEALVVMHQALREMPGPRAEMTAVVAHWEPANAELHVANCGHVAPVILREQRGGGAHADPQDPWPRGASQRKAQSSRRPLLAPGDRLVMVSDGVTALGEGQAGLGDEGVDPSRAAIPARHCS